MVVRFEENTMRTIFKDNAPTMSRDSDNLRDVLSVNARINLRAKLSTLYRDLSRAPLFADMLTKGDARWWFRYDMVGKIGISSIAEGRCLHDARR